MFLLLPSRISNANENGNRTTTTNLWIKIDSSEISVPCLPIWNSNSDFQLMNTKGIGIHHLRSFSGCLVIADWQVRIQCMAYLPITVKKPRGVLLFDGGKPNADLAWYKDSTRSAAACRLMTLPRRSGMPTVRLSLAQQTLVRPLFSMPRYLSPSPLQLSQENCNPVFLGQALTSITKFSIVKIVKFAETVSHATQQPRSSSQNI